MRQSANSIRSFFLCVLHCPTGKRIGVVRIGAAATGISPKSLSDYGYKICDLIIKLSTKFIYWTGFHTLKLRRLMISGGAAPLASGNCRRTFISTVYCSQIDTMWSLFQEKSYSVLCTWLITTRPVMLETMFN